VIGRRTLDALFEVATSDVLGAGDVSLIPLVGLTDINEHEVMIPAFVRLDQLMDDGGINLVDLVLYLLEELCARGRHFQIT
jgi:hypothetical protein